MTTIEKATDIELIGHLMRRAAFGEPVSRLEIRALQSYESIVDDLINVERFPRLEEDLLERHHIQHVDDDSFQWPRGPMDIQDDKF